MRIGSFGQSDRVPIIDKNILLPRHGLLLSEGKTAKQNQRNEQ
jgi:hypothetical protein